MLDLLLPEEPPGHLLTRLMDRWPAYLAYVASYLLIGVVWLTQVSAFAHIRYMDDGMQWCNLAVLITTGLLPFPTAVLAETIGSGSLADERVAVGLYGALGALTTLSWPRFIQYMSRHPALLASVPSHFRFLRGGQSTCHAVTMHGRGDRNICRPWPCPTSGAEAGESVRKTPQPAWTSCLPVSSGQRVRASIESRT